MASTFNWTQQNKDWAIYVFMVGLGPKAIARRLQCTPEEVVEFVDRCLRGEEVLQLFPTDALFQHKKWTARQDRILRTMREHKQSLNFTARLLYRSTAEVINRWDTIKHGKGI